MRDAKLGPLISGLGPGDGCRPLRCRLERCVPSLLVGYVGIRALSFGHGCSLNLRREMSCLLTP